MKMSEADMESLVMSLKSEPSNEEARSLLTQKIEELGEAFFNMSETELDSWIDQLERKCCTNSASLRALQRACARPSGGFAG